MNLVLLILGIFLLSMGLFFIFAPYAMKRANEYCNRVIFTDAKLFMGRRLGGILFIIFGIFLFITSYFSSSIWGEFLWGGAGFKFTLMGIGIVSFLSGMLFVTKPLVLIRISNIGNKILFSDEKIETYPRIFGSILLAVGLTILYELLTKM